MSIPICCNECGQLIGEQEALAPFCLSGHVCPGEGNHKKPERTEELRFFGLLRKVWFYYPETQTVSTWQEYIGPLNKFLIWFVIIFGTEKYPNGSHEGIVLNGKWIWWKLKIGFYGDGMKELKNLSQS